MYDVIVIGGGHAGCEAALAPAVIGKKTLLITPDLDMVGSMPCNPSIGGPAKGVVVREIDALGGYMGKNADLARIQVKMLNSSKGPAVRALRFQEDKILYRECMLKHLKAQENLDLLEALVEKIYIDNNKAAGVILNNGEKILSKTVVLTTGTYMRSRILRGSEIKEEGPDKQPTSTGISDQLKEIGFEIQRLKTGTPARIYTDSIDFSKTRLEPGSQENYRYSFDDGFESITGKNVPCYLTYTNPEIHELITEHLDESAMYGGIIEGVGPRYCPSIETKIIRFADKTRHQIFFEPESLRLNETYIQGYSTSMPVEIQDKMLHMLPGLENCRVARYAYSIEYDAINPLQLKPSLETKLIDNLFFAGQINGTSGYEEAAAQGLMASINAVNKVNNNEPLILRRDEAYIGVLIDDLVTKGTKEPYRLLTSRAEYRLLLRHDNADIRLRKYGYDLGLISESQMDILNKKITRAKELVEELKEIKVPANSDSASYLKSLNSSELIEGTSAFNLIKRPEVDYKSLKRFLNIKDSDEIFEQVEISIKYAGYIKKANEAAHKMLSADSKLIPDDIDYSKASNIAIEACEKLEQVKPRTLGQASRISGVNPSDIAVLNVYIETLRRSHES